MTIYLTYVTYEQTSLISFSGSRVTSYIPLAAIHTRLSVKCFYHNEEKGTEASQLLFPLEQKN